MKKIIYLLAAILFSCQVYASKDTYKSKERNTKPWGCLDSYEKSSPSPGGGTLYELDCWGEGEKVCQFKDGTCPLVVSQSREEVKNQILAGVLFGTVETTWGLYSWNATDIENYDYTVEVDIEE